MARVSIEDRCFVSLGPLSDELGWPEARILGHLTYLWHGSQDQLKISGSIKEIRRWSRCEESDVQKFVEALTEFNFLEKISEDEFLIRGNKKHVQNLKTLKKISALGGKARAKGAKRKADGTYDLIQPQSSRASSRNPADDPAVIQPASSPLQCITMQGNAEQCSAEQCSAEQCNAMQSMYSELAARWLDFAKAQSPHIRFSLSDFEEGVAHVCRNVPLTIEQLEFVFDFIRQDDFWKSNALSPKGLMKKSSRNDLRKIDNIMARLKEKHGKYDEVLAWANDPNAESIDPFSYTGGFSK